MNTILTWDPHLYRNIVRIVVGGTLLLAFAKCPVDGSLLESLTPEVPQQTVSLEVKGRVCQVCFTHYDAEMAFCPKDNAPLFVDLGQWETIKEELLEKNEKINVQRSFQSEKKPQGDSM